MRKWWLELVVIVVVSRALWVFSAGFDVRKGRRK